ncbi:MAG: hypothetical protein KAT48_14210 [Bacteroidales bacterium]|nr:hypothetical protein [Bacteroidales bacterium]
MIGEKTTAEEAAEKARIAREEANKKKLDDERGSAGAVPGPKAPGSAGQGKKNGNDEAFADAAKQAIFIELGKEGTMMITKPGEYKGVYQPPIVMITQTGSSRLDKNNLIKSNWSRFSMLASTRIFNALKENAEYINQYAQEELDAITGMSPVG